MKKLIFAALLIASSNAFAATAYWTGQSELVQTVTYQMAYNCQYSYMGQYFWVVYANSCPYSIEVM